MDRRRVRGVQQQERLSVKALGQMFEELIRVSVTSSDGITAFAAPNNSHKKHESRIGGSNTIKGILKNKEEKSSCGQCDKPTLTNLDGNHVKSRKQFFEEQAHTTETSAAKIKPSNETPNKLDELPYLKNRRSREICACDVKSKRQIFEGYVNNVDNNKLVPVKSVENIALQQRRFYHDILNSTPVLNNYPTMKNNVIEDVLTNDKEYVTTCEYSSPTTNLNDVDGQENELRPDTMDAECKSIDVEFDSTENSSTCEDENVNNYANYDCVNMKEDYTQRDFEGKAETSNNKVTADEYDMVDNNFTKDYSYNNDLSSDPEYTTHAWDRENIFKNQEDEFPDKNVDETAFDLDDNKENDHSKDFVAQSETITTESEDVTQNNEIAAEFVSYRDDTTDQSSISIISLEAKEKESNTDVVEDEDAANYIAFFNNNKEELGQSYSENEENQSVFIFPSNSLIDSSNKGENDGKIDQDQHEESTDVTKTVEKADILTVSEDLIQINVKNVIENKEKIIDVKSHENVDKIEYETNASIGDIIEKPNTDFDESNENIYHNILHVSSIDDDANDISETTVEDRRFVAHPKEVYKNDDDNKSSLRSDSPSVVHIEECISDVTEAFESINVLCNKPRWNVWDIAKKEEATTLVDLEDEVFGAILDIDSDFCVETFNNGEENVLFKIWYGREVLTQENEFANLQTSIDAIYDGDLLNKTEDEDTEYTFIDDDERDDISGTFFDKDENPRIEIIGDRGSSDMEIPQLNIPKSQYMIIKELIDSEDIYLNKLKYVTDNYLQHFRSLEVSTDIEIVFGNIEEIYNETEKIHSTLQECVSIDEIARIFLTNVHIFDCYTEYMKNKGKSTKYTNEQFSELIKDRQMELDDQFTCESYFSSVMERPERYKSFLEKLKKSVTKSGIKSEALDEAVIMLHRKIEETNTILAINSINLCPIDLKEMEPFLMKETFNIKRKYKSVVFLFRGGVIFCVEDQEEPDLYDFVEHIEMDKLAIRHSSSSMAFQLSSFDKSKRSGDESQYEFNIEGPSMGVKEKWVDEIQRILWCQLQYYKDQQKTATILTENKQHTAPGTTGDGDDQYEDIHVANGGNESTKNSGENEDPEYLVIQDVVDEEELNKISGIFFDKNENPRIEIIRSESLIGDGVYMENVPKSQYMIIKELINTEETYLRKMKHIIDSYYLYFKNMGAPPDIQIVFGNIQDIYNETEKMYLNFLDCDSVDTIAQVFLNNTHIFDLYTDYMRNKSTSYYYANTKFKRLIRDRQIELEDQYTCDSYLLNPVQRPGRYKLLLEKLEKELFKTNESSEPLRNAVLLINEKITEANTFMTIDSIQKCPINLQKMGPFIMKETFNIRRKYRSVIFLFKDIIVFCSEDTTRPDSYIYTDSIEMTKLTISHNRSSTSFQLRNFDKSKLSEENRYIFDVEAPSMSVKERWMEEIQRLLWGQLQYFKDQQKRTSLNKLGPAMSFIRKGSMKEKTKPYDSNTKSRKRSTFYYDIK